MANLPSYYQSAQTLCTNPDPSGCPTGQLTSIYAHLLGKLHLSVAAVAICFATLTIAVSVAYWAVGLLIFWRKSQEWMGLFVSLFLVIFAAINMFGFPTPQTPPFVLLLDNIINAVLPFVLFLFSFTFPTGRFTPRWTLVPFALLLVGTLPFVPAIVSVLLLPLPVGVQVYRYVRVYNAVQRQQTKWFIFGFGLGALGLALYYLLNALAPGLSAPDSWYQLINPFTWLWLWTLLLLAITMAILRYRLWDIDVIINRTLVYGSLTILLVGLYLGLILALQSLVEIVTGKLSQQQPLVVVISTLVIAALFQPLRHRLQNFIDHRFYRRKYDATKVIAAFSITLRQEVDLEQLQGQLLSVVQETMQPAHVSLWQRQPSGSETPSPLFGTLSPEGSWSGESSRQESPAPSALYDQESQIRES